MATAGNFSVGLLLFIFVARVITTLLCFSSGAPGGIFAPMLALGTVLGTAFGMAASSCFRTITWMRARLPSPDGGTTGCIDSRAVNGLHSGAGDDR
ncbi:chloride channel protein [Shigella flexneri]